MKIINKKIFLYSSLALWFLAAATLIGLTEEVVNLESVVAFDKYWSLIFLNWRSDLWISIFSVLTWLGNWQLVALLILLVIYFLLRKKQQTFILPFLFTIASAETVTFIGKLLVGRSRPLSAAIYETDFSFPSGHATIAVTFYGYLAYMLCKLAKNKKQPVAVSVGTLLIVLLIGFSRLYLGVHYISDVLAGYLVGLLALIAGLNLNEWLETKSNQKSRQ
ncbi:MAG: phosphatase PAP2 family protein [Candidatus Falkowbacteria bacterium]